MKKIGCFIGCLVSVIVALWGVSMTIGGNYWAGIPVTVFGFICFSLVAAFNSQEKQELYI